MYIHLFTAVNPPIPLPCLCATLRRATRALTARYDEALRPHGLTTGQFTLLQTLQTAGPVAQGRLADILAIDSTTLTRSLAPAVKAGWVERGAAADRRAWSLSVSPRGRQVYEAAMPAWEAAQQDLRRELGRDAWRESFQAAEAVTAAARRLSPPP
jgi:DNA-binding MarR family transcriptional regulator